MTLWDITTMTLEKTFDISDEVTGAPTFCFVNSFFIGKGGRKMYMIEDLGKEILEWDLSTPWDIETMTFNQKLDTDNSNFFSSIRSLWFTPDGLTMFTIGCCSVRRYQLSTAWDISTVGAFDQQEGLPEDNSHEDMWFRQDGLEMYTVGTGTTTEGSPDRIYRYELTTPYDLDTLTFDSLQGSFHTTENFPNGFFWKPEGDKFFVMGADNLSPTGNADVYQYPTSGDPFDFTPNTVQSVDISDTEDIPFGIFFHPSGAKMYHLGREGCQVYQWTLGDIPILTIDKEFFVNAKLIQDGRIVPESQPTVSAILIPPPQTLDKEFFIGARVVWFCDNIEDNTGWVITNGGGQISVDDISAPDVIRLEQLAGGGGITERWARKDIVHSLSGDMKIDFKLDFIDNSAPQFGALWIIQLQENVSHPEVNPGQRLGFIMSITNNPTQILLGRATDSTSTVVASRGGSKNQHTLHVYRNSGSAQSDVKGPYYVTIELDNGKLRTSLFKDPERTRHFRGSPVEVDAIGLNPTNLRYLTISNSKGSGTARHITAEIDEIYITQNESATPIPDKVFPATGSFVDEWESHSTGDQNPSPWFSQTDFTSGETPEIDIHEVSTENPDTGVKDFKMHTKFINAGGFNKFGRSSVTRIVDAIPTEDGSGLDIPLALSARMRADILAGDSFSRSASVTVQYTTIAGAPSGGGVIQFRLFGNGNSEIWNGSSWVSANSRRLSESNTLGQYAGFEDFDLKQIFDSDSFVSDNNALDFESHIDAMFIAFGAKSTTLNIGSNTENLIYGDFISLLNSGVKVKTFEVNTSLIASPIKEFTIRAELSSPQIKEFFVSAVVGTPQNFEFFINARVVIRSTVNSAIVNAILVGTKIPVFVNALVKAFNQEEEFFVDALIAQFTAFSCVSAILVPTIQTKQETFEINGLIRGSATRDMLVNAKIVAGKTFLIDSIVLPRKTEPFLVDAVTELTEPQSILEAESVIGHKTGLQG